MDSACAVDLLRCEELVCRAWDEAMNTQPNVLTWNVMGELSNLCRVVLLNVALPELPHEACIKYTC